MDIITDIPDDYFNEFIDHEIKVECKSWPECSTRADWGTNFAKKCTPGNIWNVKTNRKTNTPVFTVYFADIDQVFINLDLDHMLKVPLKYHFVKDT